MIKELINKINSKQKEKIKEYISNYQTKSIETINFWTVVEYDQGMDIYKSNKNQYKNELEAFVTMWTNYLVNTEEQYDYYEPTLTFAEDVFNYSFKDNVSQYTCKKIDNEVAKEYINQTIKRMLRNALCTRKKYPTNSYEHTYPNGMPGIFINRKMIKENEFQYFVDSILQAEEMYYDDFAMGYKELFLETETEYIYFCGQTDKNSYKNRQD